MLAQVLAFCTAERMSVLLVSLVGSMVGAYAADGWRHGEQFLLSPMQWGGAAMAISGSILVAVLVRTWPAKAATIDNRPS
jgi:hypothetical protein